MKTMIETLLVFGILTAILLVFGLAWLIILFAVCWTIDIWERVIGR